MLASMHQGEGADLFASNQARVSDMIFTQPVVYELDLIAVPTLLMIGQKDITAIGKERASPEIAKSLGHYPELGQKAQQRIKNSTLVPFAELGHAPQVQDPAEFNKALIEHLTKMP
jgi:pimeloyl-ACP methyl ester carboxylesterase